MTGCRFVESEMHDDGSWVVMRTCGVTMGVGDYDRQRAMGYPCMRCESSDDTAGTPATPAVSSEVPHRIPMVAAGPPTITRR